MLFDSLTAARQLTEAGMDETQAAAVVGVLRSAVTEGVTARSYKAEWKAEMAELRAEFKIATAEIRAEIADFRAAMYRAVCIQTAAIVGLTVALVKLL